eukprot:919910-Pleurochrysis_carterae.AAC.3
MMMMVVQTRTFPRGLKLPNYNPSHSTNRYFACEMLTTLPPLLRLARRAGCTARLDPAERTRTPRAVTVHAPRALEHQRQLRHTQY